jgi:hypothetical protein
MGTSGRRAGRNCAGSAPNASVPSSALCNARQQNNSHVPHPPGAHISPAAAGSHELCRCSGSGVGTGLVSKVGPGREVGWAAAVQNGRSCGGTQILPRTRCPATG